MKLSESLKNRKFNLDIPKLHPKSTKNITPQEKNENKENKNNNKNKIIIKILGNIPYLFLPVKNVPHLINKKQKNQKINIISLEKLKDMVLNLKMNKNEQKKLKRGKSQNKKMEDISPSKYIHSQKYKSYINKDKYIKQSRETLSEDKINLYKKKSFYEKGKKTNNITANNDKDICINRATSFDKEINNNILGYKELQYKNKDNQKLNSNIEFISEKYNDLILMTENLEKNILTNYLNGTDKLISEMEEPLFFNEDLDININITNQNGSLTKHLSKRETASDTSYHNSNSHKNDKMKGKNNDIILKVKNYRKLFKKYNTNFTIKTIENNNKNKENILKWKRRNVHKKKKKLPIFNKSLSNINYYDDQISNTNLYININDYKNDIKVKNSNKCPYHRNISYDYEIKNLSLNEIKNRVKKTNNLISNDNEKNKLYIDKRNPSLDIIKETNDNNLNLENIEKDSKPKSKKKIKNTKIIQDNKKKYFSEKNLSNYNPKNLYSKIKQNISKNYIVFNGEDNIFKSDKKTSIDDYIISTELGKGSYASVKLGIHKETKNKYAVKIYDKYLINDEEKKYTIKNEIFILSQLDDENVMKLYDVIETNRYLYLIMEYIDGISLLDFIQKHKNHRIEENECKELFYQIVKGILYCQNENICHRDIKLENILIVNNKVIKIIDFGFAIKCNRNEYQEFFCGTVYYMPPEIVNKKKYIPFYSDIWSLGVLLYAMLFGDFPFRANKQEELFQLITEGNLIFPDDIEVSDKAKNLLSKIFVNKPTKRISLEELLNDPWFKEK